MSRDQRFIDMVLPDLINVKSDYRGNTQKHSFACPFCADLITGEKKRESRKRHRVAAFMPTKECDYVYTFNCRRCNTSLNILQFLYRHRPYLAEKYKSDRNHQTSSNETFDRQNFAGEIFPRK